MARLPRLYVPGCANHLIQRGNNRQDCFVDSLDRRMYLRYLKEAADKFHVDIHSFVLMTNHSHFLVTPEGATGCGQMMQSLGRRYVGYFNNRYSRTGTLWEGRYKSTLVDSDHYFFAVSRYIELNPVRAGMVSDPGLHQWSSFHFHGLGLPNDLITPHPLYLALGSTPKDRSSKYQRLFSHPLDLKTLSEIRSATNKAWALGSASFKRAIMHSASRRVAPIAKGGDRKSKSAAQITMESDPFDQ